MSKKVAERGEGDLQVLNSARILKKYTLEMLRNDKRFPKSSRWLYAIPIATEIRTVCICIRHANATHIRKEAMTFDDAYRYRRSEQTRAHASLDAMYDLIDDAFQANYIDGRQSEYWTGLVKQTDDLLKAWIKSDIERFEKK